jgi:hypothetical protein
MLAYPDSFKRLLTCAWSAAKPPLQRKDDAIQMSDSIPCWSRIGRLIRRTESENMSNLRALIAAQRCFLFD